MEDPSNPLIEGELEVAENDGFSLIDGSELEDLFVSMSEPRLEDDKANTVDGGVTMMERPEAEKPRKNEKYNLRKSLAWDSAFFTSAGVLDAEELSSIMDVGNDGKHQMQHLPGIQEDISKSTDSLSTLESDNLTIESLEADLFSDIRASIQRSGESSKLRKSNLNGRPQEPSQLGKKTTEIKHGNMVKPKSTPKKLIANLEGDGKLMKLGPSREQVRKPVVSKREPSSSLLKPAAASGKVSSMVMAAARIPTKRMSISAGRIKSDNNNVGSQTGRVINVSKGDRPCDSRSVIPKAASYAKSSSGSSTTNRTGISSARSSVDSTSSSSSQGSRILPLNGLQGKTNRPVSIPPPGVKSRFPSRVPVKVKNPPSSSRISAKLSASMLSPTVSPTSSMSEWSSSSSTFTANQENRDCSSLHRTFSFDSNASQDSQLHPNQQSSSENEIEMAGVSGVSAIDLSTDSASVSNPVSAKPSGLRMPSPKIGFFDGVKSGGRAQNAVGSMQSRSRLSNSRLPRSTTGSSSPGGVLNKGRIGNAAVKTTALAAAKANPDTPKSNARMAANGGGRSEGMSTAPTKESTNIRACEDVTKRTPLKTNEENNSAATKLPVGEKHHSESGHGSRKKSGLTSPSKSANPEEKSHFQGNQVSSLLNAPNKESKVRACEDITKRTPIKTNEEPNSAAAKLPVGEKYHSESGSSSRIKSGLVSPPKHATPEEISHFQGKQVSNAEEADNETMEMNNDSNVTSAQISHELFNRDTVKTELHPTSMSEEVGAAEADQHTMERNDDSEVLSARLLHEPVNGDNANEVDQSADTAALNGDNEKNDQSSAVEADQHIMEMNDDSEVLSAQLLHESINGDHASKVEENADTLLLNVDNKKNDQVSAVEADQHIMELNGDSEVLSAQLIHATISEDNAIKVDENANTVVPNGHNEQNDQICAVIVDQQNVIAEKQVNGLIANVESMDNKQGLCDAMDGRFEPHSNLNSVSNYHSPADLPKQTDLSASLKMLESKPGTRTPLADKNSSSDAYSVEVLLKSFTSLSLDNA